MNNNFGTDGFGPSETNVKNGKPPQYTVTYYGTQAQVNFSGSIYYNFGYDVKYTQGNPWTMTATLNTEVGGDGISPITGLSGSYNVLNWSYHYNTTPTELLAASPLIIPWITNIVQSDRVLLQRIMNNPPIDGVVIFNSTSSVSNTDATYQSVNWNGNSASIAACSTIWNMHTNGFKTIDVIQPVLRLSMIVPSGASLSFFNTNIYSVYTLATLITTLGIPSNWSGIMPMGSDPSSTTTQGIPFHFCWQKQPPSNVQNGSTISIDQDFVYNLYPQNVYGTAL